MDERQTPEKRPIARVNGMMVSRAPRARGGDKTHYNPDIQWLLNESRGELGEQGHSIDPAGGGGARDPSNNWPLIDRLHQRRFAVARQRRLNGIMAALPADTQATLRERYRVTEREHSEVMGLRAAFGDLSTLAWWACQDRDDMRRRLSSGKGKRDPEVTRLRNRAMAMNRGAHLAWLDAEAMIGTLPPRTSAR